MYGRGVSLGGKRIRVGLGLFKAIIRAATIFDLCSRETRAFLCDETQSETAWRLGIELQAGVMAETGVEGREELNIRRRIGLSGATLGMRMESGGRSRERRVACIEDFMAGG